MPKQLPMIRCINLDWLEVFAIEPLSKELDVAYFRKLGFKVEDRGYGTRMYAEMFTIFSNNIPFIEVRRRPLSVKDDGGIFEKGACHIRLSNRTCYCEEPINVIRTFLLEYGYTFRGISRIDICMDFVKFDDGDNPKDFIRRYMESKFSKINQTVAKARWEDNWDERCITWISWGLHSSMVSTKMYLKSRELKNVGDKPWIRQAWKESGLIDNMDVIDKDIWRVEFSIKGGSASWVKLDHNNDKEKNNINHKYENMMPNSLEQYESRYKLMFVFFQLADRYFHFKYVEKTEDGKLRRKDRCRDKVLFRNTLNDVPYKLTRITTAVPMTRKIIYLLKNLRSYEKTVYDLDTKKSFNDAINWIDCQLRGIEREISVKTIQDIFMKDFFNAVECKEELPFIGDDFEKFVYQYAFNKGFMENK